jgi:hypothetical protein
MYIITQRSTLCFGSKGLYEKHAIHIGDGVWLIVREVLVFYGSFNTAVFNADYTTSNSIMSGKDESDRLICRQYTKQNE